jgi:hypothetical protein
MKKINILGIVLVSLCFSQYAFSQSKKTTGLKGETTPMQIGSVFLNLGIGVGADYKGDNYGTGFGFKASAEFGLWQAGPGVVTLGPEIGGSFSSSSNYYNNGNNNGSYNSNTFVVAGRSAWHYGWDVPGLDTYGGVSAGIGFHHYGYDYNDYSNNSVIPAFGVFVGGSYFISPTFGFNAEAGYDITNFQVGVVFKLK